MTQDVLILGGGPAGLSAAVNVIARGGTCTVLSNDYHRSPLYKAEQIDNYSGMRGQSGAQLLDAMRREAEQAGAAFLPGRATAILPFGDTFSVTAGDEMLSARRLILAVGAGAAAPGLPGEKQYLGRGISYCATCDGRLYRGRRALVSGNAAELAAEAAFLVSVGVAVTVITRRPVPGLDPAIPAVTAAKIVLWETDGQLRGLTADGQEYPADVVFLLREVTAPTALLPGLETDGRFIRVNRQMETNISGCYAAGDCTGQPLQVAKAVGEGLIAAQNAMKSLSAGNEQK